MPPDRALTQPVEGPPGARSDGGSGLPRPAVPGLLPQMLLSASAGMLLFLSFPPADLWPVAFVALVPWLVAIGATRSYRRAVLCGAVAALAFYLPSFAWVASVALTGWLGLTVYCGLYVAVAGGIIRLLQRSAGALWPLLAALLWAGLELLRAQCGPGFPWLFLGYTQYRYAGLLQLAALGGVYAVSFVVVLVNASLAGVIIAAPRRCHSGSGAGLERPLLALGLSAALLFFLTVLGGAVESGLQIREGPAVGVVQQNIPRLVEEIYDPRKDIEERYREGEAEVRLCAQLTARLRQDDVCMVAWPETSVPVPLDLPAELFGRDRERSIQKETLDYVRLLGGQMDACFLVGAPAYVSRQAARSGSLLYGVQAQPEFGNSAVLLSPRAEFVERYDKMRLVPFGEYIPLREELPFLQALTPIPRELTPGREEVVFSLPTGESDGAVRFGALICYEDVFPDLTADFRRRGVDFFVNLTDEGWYFIPGELGQHLAMAVFRAVETRTTVVRAANTGMSCFINPRGEVYAALRPHEEGALSARIQLCDAVTPYVKHGDAFAVLCLMLAIALPALLAALRRHPGG